MGGDKLVRPYKIDPKLTTMKDEMLEAIKEGLERGQYDADDAPVVLGITLAIGYCHEFFKCMQVISDQLERKRG